MIRCQPLGRATAVLTAIALLCLQFGSAATVQAALVTSAQALSPVEADDHRSRLKALLERDDVSRQLQQWGVDPAEARAHVDSLDEVELARLADQIDSLPAGRGALEFILISALVVFLVLLCTDIAGYTDVFPFVR
ncbi:MAG: PA2779 family protein [Desulfobacterales bacterium]|nr:PA2779 family protein [Desulfobacterales bacterium]MDJ0856351.1 PA2779 family protein [Desulfobacterales bacterium]MDJ0887362.1 PA2779 family protein [Desulfobacterales bacterium]MDJ0990877.1 PA2779 family protein [Desulfobacterales bacterium]